jgi:hypothetical protein
VTAEVYVGAKFDFFFLKNQFPKLHFIIDIPSPSIFSVINLVPP